MTRHFVVVLLFFGCTAGPTGPGTIRVTVTGVASSVGSGGSVTATNDSTTLKLDLPGTLPSTGQTTGELGGVPPGTYQVKYTPPVGHRLLAAVLNPLTVTVAAGQTVSATFAAQPVPQPALAFASDWRTATGNTDNAVRDGTKWGAATSFE